jgi:hypothetical protein
MPENQVPMGFPARVVGIFTAPSSVFEELARRPTWLAALLALTLVIASLNAIVVFSKTGEAALRQEMQDKMPKGAPPEALEQQLAITKYAGPAAIVVFTPLVTLILAGVVYLIFSVVMGGEGTFRQTFSVYAHTSLIGIVGALVGTAMIFLKGNMKSSTALSAFLPFLEESSFAYRFCQGLDLFVLWQLGVLAVGMAIVNRTSTRRAATPIFSVYLVLWLLITVVRQALS